MSVEDFCVEIRNAAFCSPPVAIPNSKELPNVVSKNVKV